MKRIFAICLMLSVLSTSFAVNVNNRPVSITQPDGSVLECFVTGDEYYARLHDANNYTIVMGEDGFYYYAKEENGQIVSSALRATGGKKLNLKGLTAGVGISEEAYAERIKIFHQEEEGTANVKASSADTYLPHRNQLCMLIRFKGEADFTIAELEKYDSVFNAETNSLKHYYLEVSFGKQDVRTYIAPYHFNGENGYSYEDSYPRSYYEPYSTANPTGYKNISEQTNRRLSLLRSAITWLSNLDCVSEEIAWAQAEATEFDNFAFIIKGNANDWSDLLWAHRSEIPSSYTAKINGISVKNYLFCPENQTDAYTVRHEFFHTLSAPDLYHYNAGTNLTPVGTWDLMEHGNCHMSVHLKEKYGKWFNNIPETISSGAYTIKPIMSDTMGTAYKFIIPGTRERFKFYVEYRQQKGLYESSLPGEGLLCYRLDGFLRGNASYDGRTKFDEIYLFRPGGTYRSNGNIRAAAFHQNQGRTSANDTTETIKFYRENGDELGVSIWNVKITDEEAYFRIYIGDNFDPQNVVSYNSGNNVNFEWKNDLSADSVLVIASNEYMNFDIPEDGKSYNEGYVFPKGGKLVFKGKATSFSHLNTSEKEIWYYRIHSMDVDKKYSIGVEKIMLSTTDKKVCENIANHPDATKKILVRDNFGGYFSGHNSYPRSEFAEKLTYKSKGFIKSVFFEVGKNHASNSDSKVSLWLSEVGKDGYPGEKFYIKDLKISDLKLGVNEHQLEQPLRITSDLFMGFTVYYQDGTSYADTFAVMQIDPEEIITPSMYVLERGKWKSAEESRREAASLAMGIEVCNNPGDEADYFIAHPSYVALSRSEGAVAEVNVWTNLGKVEIQNLPDWAEAIVDNMNDKIYFIAKSATTTQREAQVNIVSSEGGSKTITLVQTTVGIEGMPENTLLLSVYPNPSSNGLFTMESKIGSEYIILDYTGKLIQQSISKDAKTTIDLSSYPAGIYFVRLMEQGQSKLVKLIKQ